MDKGITEYLLSGILFRQYKKIKQLKFSGKWMETEKKYHAEWGYSNPLKSIVCIRLYVDISYQANDNQTSICRTTKVAYRVRDW